MIEVPVPGAPPYNHHVYTTLSTVILYKLGGVILSSPSYSCYWSEKYWHIVGGVMKDFLET